MKDGERKRPKNCLGEGGACLGIEQGKRKTQGQCRWTIVSNVHLDYDTSKTAFDLHLIMCCALLKNRYQTENQYLIRHSSFARSSKFYCQYQVA